MKMDICGLNDLEFRKQVTRFPRVFGFQYMKFHTLSNSLSPEHYFFKIEKDYFLRVDNEV